MTGQTFTSITPTRWADIQATFNKGVPGVQVTGDSGTETDPHGIEFSWKYDSGNLNVTVIKVPWFVPTSEKAILSKLTAFINSTV